MLEKELEAKLVSEIEKKGGQALKFNSSKSGMPDRIILLPGGIFAFVEMKAPGEKPRPIQQKRIDDFIELGFRVEVIDSAEKIDAFIKGVIT